MKNNVVTRPAVEGCLGCCFNREQGAKECEYARKCFAHLREDRESVIFKYIKNDICT